MRQQEDQAARDEGGADDDQGQAQMVHFGSPEVVRPCRAVCTRSPWHIQTRYDARANGGHEILRSTRNVPSGAHRLGVHVERLVRKEAPAKGSRTGVSEYTLLIDGEPVGTLQTQLGFHTLISWSGLDIGRDRGSPVSHYDAPFEFTGKLLKVTVKMHNDQTLDGEGVGNAEMARQ
jgi:hypothetical protein